MVGGLSQRALSPWPSEPTTSASRSTSCGTTSIATESSASVMAYVVYPASRSRSGAPYQSSTRAYGSQNTEPIDTLIARR